MILASLTLLAADNGGRTNPIFSGYRPQFFFDDQDFECRSFEVEQESGIYPGQTAQVRIILSDYAASKLKDKVGPGRMFELHEGKKTVAVGTVIAVDQQKKDLER
jgi:elongation factor Tu